MKQSQFARALWYGILGALFFAFTFIFNRSMNLSGVQGQQLVPEDLIGQLGAHLLDTLFC